MQAAEVTDAHSTNTKLCNDIGGQAISWDIFYDSKGGIVHFLFTEFNTSHSLPHALILSICLVGYKYEVPKFCSHPPANLIQAEEPPNVDTTTASVDEAAVA